MAPLWGNDEGCGIEYPYHQASPKPASSCTVYLATVKRNSSCFGIDILSRLLFTTYELMSSRRSACDRCCDQKLRCLRDPDVQRCRRCNKSDAECTMKPRFRMRNYTGNPTAKRRGRDVSNVREDPKEPLSNSRPEESEGLDQHGPPETPVDAMLVNTFGVLPTEQNESSLSQLDFTTSTVALNTNYGTSAPTFSFPLPVSGRLEKWYQNNTSLFNFTMFPAASSSADAEASDEKELPLSSSIDFEPLPVPNLISSSGHPMLSAYTDLLAGMRSHKAGNGFSMALNDEELAMVEETTLQAVNLPAEELQQTPTQRLQHIQFRLSELAAYMGRSFPDYPPDKIVSGIVKGQCLVSGLTKVIIENILYTTGRFLDVLCSMANSQRSPAATTSSPADSPTLPNMGDPKSSREAAPSSSVNNLPVTSLSSPSQSDAYNKVKSDIDITLQLLILACYIQVLRLFVALISHIQDYLEEVAGRDDPTLYPVPGLSFSSLPLCRLLTLPWLQPLQPDNWIYR